MAQNSKKITSSLKKNKRPSAAAPKRGTRVIAPKKPRLIAKRKLMKKHTAGLTALTEKNLAEKAGHLEMLAGGKKDRLKEEGRKAKANGTMDRQ